MYRTGTKKQHDEVLDDMAIDNAAALPFELEAELKDTGELVTLLQTCNWPGHSPSFVAVDSSGDPLIASFNEVRIRDHRAVPNEKLYGSVTRKNRTGL